MKKFYKIGNYMCDEHRLLSHGSYSVDGPYFYMHGSSLYENHAINTGSPENAKRAFDATARLLGAEDLLAPDADEGGDEKSAASEPDADGWIPWSGGYCPVPGETQVEIRLHNGTIVKDIAGCLRWTRWGVSGDIAAYRIVSEAPASEKEDAPWQPKEGEDYYYINEGGDIDSTDYISCSPMDCVNKSFGNIFRTREEAEVKRAEIFGE